jgi:hypothetical protein
MFESATGIPVNSSQSNMPLNQAVLQGVSQEQLENIKKLARTLRIVMIVISTCMMIVCYYNLGTVTTTSSSSSTTGSSVTSTSFIAVYVLFFATLICCYEIGWSAIASTLVQNFGFLYYPISRLIFLILVSISFHQKSFTAAVVLSSNILVFDACLFLQVEILLFQLSTFGIVIFVFLLIAMLMELAVSCKYPKYEKYVRLTHMNITPLPDTGQSTLQVV